MGSVSGGKDIIILKNPYVIGVLPVVMKLIQLLEKDALQLRLSQLMK